MNPNVQSLNLWIELFQSSLSLGQAGKDAKPWGNEKCYETGLKDVVCFHEDEGFFWMVITSIKNNFYSSHKNTQ